MSDLLRKIDSIALFRGVRYKEPLNSLCEYLKLREGGNCTMEQLIESYSAFVSILYDLRSDADLSAAVWDALENDMNPYLRHRIESLLYPEDTPRMSTLLSLACERELNLLTQIGSFTSARFKDEMYYDGYLPDFNSSKIDFRERYMDMIERLPVRGYGIYAEYIMFRIENGEIKPVRRPDLISAEELFCYERQRSRVIENTEAFLSGKPAADILLYGDAGTGKSSTVKAVARKYADKGLRLVELPKPEIDNLTLVLDKLSQIPMKFILYIDDLSFDSEDERIGIFKSVLEGSAADNRRNILVYCTSNRRHIVKESFSDRNDEVHSTDTVAEQLSLSERFGLRILFDKPNKETYLQIIRHLCKLRGLKYGEGDGDGEDETFVIEAERFALVHGGRTARLARQYVDQLEVRGNS